MTPAFGLTASLGAFAAGFDDIPPEALQVAAHGVTDAVGTLLAGQGDPAFRTLARVLLPQGAAGREGESSLLLGAGRLRALDAAMLNAVAAHALAMDDVAAGCHPSALLMPALLAEAEALHRSGDELLRAYVVGYEVMAELSAREPDALHMAGWHPTCMRGPPAVAAAVARLRGLDAAGCTAAIAAAASMTGGLVANFGTQTKAVQVARASAAGLFAARLAAEGLTASPDALERDPGLLKAISPQGRARLDGVFAPRDAGALRILSEGLSFKKYPVCYSTHRVVDAAADLAGQPGFDAGSVASVQVDIGATQAWMAREHEVRTPFQAKYSVEFAAASGLLARDASFEQLEDDFIHAPLLQRLVGLTELRLDERRSADDPVFSPADRVVVRLRDGRLFDSGQVPYARGHARSPLSAEARRRKFLQCAAYGGASGAEALYEAVSDLARMPDVHALARAG